MIAPIENAWPVEHCPKPKAKSKRKPPTSAETPAPAAPTRTARWLYWPVRPPPPALHNLGELGPLLSPDPDSDLDARGLLRMTDLINDRAVAYIGLDSLSDGMVGGAIGSLLIAELTFMAGDRHNYGVKNHSVSVFIDEVAEVMNDPFVQLLNKGRGAGLRVTVAVILFVMEFILLSALVPTEWSNRVQEQEADWLEQTLGARTAGLIVERSDAWSERLFVRSGLMAGSYNLLIPDDASVQRAPELGKLADSPVWPWIKDRLDVIWQSVALAVQRVVLLLAWWPFLAFALVGGILDGVLRRSIRQSGFDYPSPLAHRLAVGTLLWMGVTVSLSLLLPVPIPALVAPMLAVLIAVAVGAMVTQTQKRL